MVLKGNGRKKKTTTTFPMLVNMQKSHSLQIEDNIKNITFPWLKNINLGERMCVSALSLKKKKRKKKGKKKTRVSFHFTKDRLLLP